MAVILTQSEMVDGYDAIVVLSTGEQHIFHFTAQPANARAAVDAAEVAYLASIVPPEPVEFVEE